MNKKTLATAIMLAFALPISTWAQGGTFRRGVTDESYYNCGNADAPTGLFGNRSVQTTGIIDNQTFGQEVPMGGIIILLAAGAGYAVLRRKEKRQ